MTDDDKKNLASFSQFTTQCKYGLMFALGATGLALPFFYMVLLTTNFIYPLLAGIAGWTLGYYYAKYFK